MTRFKPKLIACNSGATMVFVGLMFMLLIMVVAVIVDMGRLYAVHSKAQNASDAALLGAVSTVSTVPVEEEMVRLFNANYPASYMGSVVGDIAIVENPSSVYTATFTVTVPTTLMKLFNNFGATFNILSQVTRGFEIEEKRKLELALVLDNTGSMAEVTDKKEGVVKLTALKQAAKDLVDILFGDALALQNIHVSVIPYNTGVNIGSGFESWIQAPYVAQYKAHAASGNGFVANRNADVPPLGPTDYTDSPPQTETTRFRVPRSAVALSCPDVVHTSLPRMKFAMNQKADVKNALDAMVAVGCTRINVGVMWGWFSLSPQWKGLWDPGKPNRPASVNPMLDKVIVLMTDGKNTVYQGTAGMTSDDKATELVCESAKAQGIIIYTIGFGKGSAINEQVLKNCATQKSYYFNAPTSAELQKVFHQIADDIIFNTLRLSQ